MAAVRAIAEKALTGPLMPPAMLYLWNWYTELAQGKSEGMLGLAPLSWTDVLAWARFYQRRPAPYEVDALFKIDLTMRVQSQPPKPKKGTKPDADRSLDTRTED